MCIHDKMLRTVHRNENHVGSKEEKQIKVICIYKTLSVHPFSIEISPDAIKEKPTVPTPRRQLSEEDTTNVEDAGISSSVINRLRTENALERMKKVKLREGFFFFLKAEQ